MVKLNTMQALCRQRPPHRPPGAGQSMPARRLPTRRPATVLAGAVEATWIHRVAGRTGDRTALVTTHPCRAPHHTLSEAGLIGGGHVPRPGEGSLAPHGVRSLTARLTSCSDGVFGQQ
jgi:predicted ATPase with chaperone activity